MCAAGGEPAENIAGTGRENEETVLHLEHKRVGGVVKEGGSAYFPNRSAKTAFVFQWYKKKDTAGLPCDLGV